MPNDSFEVVLFWVQILADFLNFSNNTKNLKNMLACPKLTKIMWSHVWEEFFCQDYFPRVSILSKKTINNNFFYVLEKVQNHTMRPKITNLECWLSAYEDVQFYRFFRMSKTSFEKLCYVMCSKDTYGLIVKKYRGGHYPILPEQSVLVFLWYMGSQESHVAMGCRFGVSPQSVHNIVNACLFLVISLKKNFIKWPSSPEEYEEIRSTFTHYPGTIGAIDGSHIFLKVPKEQQDSYIDRYTRHSINLLAICNGNRLFMYVFAGFPGSAHDSRVFSNSSFFLSIEQHGSHLYFPDETFHLVGDSAFPIKRWLMTPYRRHENLNRQKRQHNYLLSADRVVIENTFGIVKNRWARIQFINVCSVSKACEVLTASCILHNFCYLQDDSWDQMYMDGGNDDSSKHKEHFVGRNDEARIGKEKRDAILREITNL